MLLMIADGGIPNKRYPPARELKGGRDGGQQL